MPYNQNTITIMISLHIFSSFYWRKVWRKNGKIHRPDGPAVVNRDGTVEYWINGIELTEYEIMFLFT